MNYPITETPFAVSVLVQKHFKRGILGRSIEAADLTYRCYPRLDDLPPRPADCEQPDILVIGCEWLQHDAAIIIATVRATNPDIHIVICCHQAAPPPATQILPLIETADPDGFCLLDELTDYLLALRANRSFESAYLKRAQQAATPPRLPGWQELSRQERRVLHLMVQGLNGPAIAEKIFISLHTVNNHKRHITQKLNVADGSGSLTCYVIANQPPILAALASLGD